MCNIISKKGRGCDCALDSKNWVWKMSFSTFWCVVSHQKKREVSVMCIRLQNWVWNMSFSTFWRVTSFQRDGGDVICTVLGKKKGTFDPHLIFRNILRRHEIFHDKVNIGVRFYHTNYGARIWPWRPPPAHKANIWTFQNGQNPGGDLEIWDIFRKGVCTLMDSANCFSISYSTNFGYKIILKFWLFMVTTEISKSKFLTHIRLPNQAKCPIPPKSGGEYI